MGALHYKTSEGGVVFSQWTERALLWAAFNLTLQCPASPIWDAALELRSQSKNWSSKKFLTSIAPMSLWMIEAHEVTSQRWQESQIEGLKVALTWECGWRAHQSTLWCWGPGLHTGPPCSSPWGLWHEPRLPRPRASPAPSAAPSRPCFCQSHWGQPSWGRGWADWSGRAGAPVGIGV